MLLQDISAVTAALSSDAARYDRHHSAAAPSPSLWKCDIILIKIILQ
jgi:hypothetical protein